MARLARSLFAAALLACALPVEAVESDPAFGLWLVENGKAIVDIGPCGPAACGRIVWMAKPLDGDGAPKRDAENADPTLRGRKLCGLDLIGDFKRAGTGQWTEGYIYDPRKGARYSARIEARGDGTLKVRGYLGLPVFGKSQTWTRVETDRGGC